LVALGDALSEADIPFDWDGDELFIYEEDEQRVDELIDMIAGEMVTYARDAYLEEAWRIVTEDLVYLPVRHGVSVFATRKDLEIPPDPWDVPRFRLARFKEEAKAAQQ
jgi:hypothetical protein